MKRIILATISILLVAMVARAGNMPKVEKTVIIDDKAAAALTNKTERLLHQIRIPEVLLAQANANDVILFLNDCITRYGKNKEQQQLRIRCDIDPKQMMTLPLLTYGGLDMSVLEAVYLFKRILEVESKVDGETLVLYKKKPNKTSEATSEPALGAASSSPQG